MRKNDNFLFYPMGKMFEFVFLRKPALIAHFKDSHQFSCKIQVIKGKTIK